MKYYSYLFILLVVLTVANKVYACDDDAYTTPLPETPKKIVMDYPRSQRADIFAERVAAMKLWVASNK